MRRLLAVLALVGVLLLSAVATAGAASPRTAAHGAFTYNSCHNSVRQAGGNLFLDITCTITYVGTLSGTSTQSGTLLIHADGRTNFHGTETFTGTVNDLPGTLTFKVASVGDATAFRETSTIIGGTDALANLHGVLRVAGTVPPPPGLPFGTYSAQLHDGTR